MKCGVPAFATGARIATHANAARTQTGTVGSKRTRLGGRAGATQLGLSGGAGLLLLLATLRDRCSGGGIIRINVIRVVGGLGTGSDHLIDAREVSVVAGRSWGEGLRIGRARRPVPLTQLHKGISTGRHTEIFVFHQNRSIVPLNSN
jgi:hypothetical protein